MIPGLSDAAQMFILQTLSEEKKIERAILFGSRATGRFREGSDVDIALVGKHLSEGECLRLARRFDDSFLPYKVDLVLLDENVSESLKVHIDQVGKDLVV